MSPICQRGQPLWNPRANEGRAGLARTMPSAAGERPQVNPERQPYTPIARNLTPSAYELRSVTHHQGEPVAELDSRIVERTAHPENADPARTHLNRYNLVEYPDGITGLAAAVEHRIANAEITRKNLRQAGPVPQPEL